MFAAYLRIDIIEERMFPLSSVMRYTSVVIPVVTYFFMAEYQGTEKQYPTILIGIAVAFGLQDALIGFTSRLTFAQERGILETYLVEPVSWWLIPVAMNLWRTAMGITVTLVMLLVGWGLGADLDMANFAIFMVILLLGVLACNAVGVFAASFLVVFKRGEPVISVYGMLAAFLGGSFFAISVLPGWIRWASYLIPNTYAISAARSTLIPGHAHGDANVVVACLVLAGFSLFAFTVGLRVFHRSLQYARRTGILST